MQDQLKTVVIVMAITVFLIGLLLVLCPHIHGFYVERELSEIARDFTEQLEQHATDATPSSEFAESQVKPYEKLWRDMIAYNAAIFKDKQAGLNNVEAYETPSFELTEYGLESEIFAVISIPQIAVELPVYLGATEQHLEVGAAILSQTSLPIGGKNTNCVIAGHRGWHGAEYFQNLDQLEPGDVVTITNLWEKLTYEVVDIKIISPENVQSIFIREERELITLLTCHPPASGGKQRYLVFCERVEEKEVS